ncbi:MAG TPA: helix-turn-helix domain-containing protein [Solirubrobacteraceae bacterium]|nr:helix-turn-helix domain-containing protein [Solirubrobacteraceae bacterium]
MTEPTVRVRERFAATGAADDSVEGAILASWIRSRLCGAGPDRREARYDGSIGDADSRLQRAARPVLETLSADITDTPTALLLSDPDARVLRRWASESTMARLMDRVCAAEGFVLSEDTVGTNGVGTPLEEGRPVAVVGTAHYNEIFDEASCAGAPVRHPVSGRVEGVVSLTCRADAHNPLQLPLIAAAARDIERRLLDAATATERHLLEAFTTARHRTTRPVLCVGEDLVLATPAAARLLEGVSQGLLWERARGAVAEDGERLFALMLDGEEELLARCRAVRDDDAMVGVLVAIDPPPRRSRPRPTSSTRLAGRSAAWRAAVAAVAECVATGTPVVVWGEPGVGKTALLRDLGVAGVEQRTAPDPSLGVRAVEIPPLRTRPEDIGPIAAALLGARRLRPEALQLLERLPWPGNVRELAVALHATHAAAIGVDDLPADLRAQAARVPTSGLQRLEAEAISRALAGCGGNKRDAARALGISRSTLYRKLRAYGLDLERRAF